MDNLEWFTAFFDTKLRKLSAICFLLGVITIGIVAIWLPEYIHNVQQTTVKESFVIASYDDSDYDDWLSNTDSDDLPEHYKFTFFHIDNADQLVSQSGEVEPPERWQVSAVGPYSYREFCRKYNVTFEEDGKYAKYTEYCWYVFDDQETNQESPDVLLDPVTDLITAINPVYVTLAHTFGGESGLENLLNYICYTIPATYDDALDCNQFGAPTPTGSMLTMGLMFGIRFPPEPPVGGILTTFFTHSFQFTYGLGGGAGLIVSRTPEQWLFFETRNPASSTPVPFFDPLLFLLRFTPSKTLDYLEQLSDGPVPRPLIFTPVFGYSINLTLSQFFASNPKFEMRYTGKDNLDDWMKYKMWEGTEVIYRDGDPKGPNVFSGGRVFPGWGDELKVDGIPSATRFKPNPSKDDIFNPWLAEAIRPMHFSYDIKTHSSIGDIEVIRFLSRGEDFYNVRYNPANAIYYHWDDSPNYLAPYEPISGVILYAGKPYFYNSSLFSFQALNNPTNAVDFLSGVPNQTLDFETYTMVEPLWGLSLEGKQQLQFSANISRELYPISAPNLPHAWVPTLIQNYQVDLSQSAADDYNDSYDNYKAADRAIELCLLIGCLVGICLVIGSVIMLWVDYKSREEHTQSLPKLKSYEMTALPNDEELNVLYTT